MLGSNPNKGEGGLNIGGRGWKLGGIGWRVQVQGGGGDTLMITKGADKCHSDQIFYLFECYFSTFLNACFTVFLPVLPLDDEGI